MKKKILAQNIFKGDYGSHLGRFHFSFADYEDPGNGPFGVLEALNDFELDPGTGFETHPHDEMEIISFCLEGSLDHADNMGNKNTLHRGDLQYLCAGSGITHSERNAMDHDSLRFLQIWIRPNIKRLSPYYCSKKFSEIPSRNGLRLVVSGEAIESVIQIHQDANIYVAELDKQQQITFTNLERRQSYLLCVEGGLAGSEFDLFQYDAIKILGREDLMFTALEKSRILIIEMASELVIEQAART